MKRLLTLAAALTLCACETVDSDGTVTRFDAKGATEAVTGALDTWQRIDRQSRIIGYDQFGNPIYRQ